jgi:parvulin-like peptidyl-prolyl isomerase
MAPYPPIRRPGHRVGPRSKFQRGPAVDTRQRPQRFPTRGLGLLLGAFIAAVGCQGTGPSLPPEQFRTPSDVTSGAQPSTDTNATNPSAPSRPAAIVDGTTIAWSTIDTSLRELGGDIALSDAVLDVLLQAEFDRLGLKLDVNYADEERDLLLASIRMGAEANEQQAQQLLDDLRRARGLGPHRFSALLRRNAMLRQLARVRIVESGAQITEDDVRRRFEIVYGPKVSARLLTVATQREASTLLAQIRTDARQPDASLSDVFARAAVAHSTDSTGARGGLLEPISLADPSYESSIRRALAGMKPGELSGVVAFENGFAILLLEETLPATLPATNDTLDDTHAALRQQLEARQERLVMERFARELLDDANVTVFDPSLDWAWEGRH